MMYLRPSPDALLLVEVEMSEGTVTVVISGDLDLTTRPVLTEHLSLILPTRPRRLVLDMSGAAFMDCGSARLIASTGRFLRDGRLIIRRPSPAVRRVLQLTGLDAECEIDDRLRRHHDGDAAGCKARPDRARAAALRGDARR
jgi:anti-sigma B factor antagonist